MYKPRKVVTLLTIILVNLPSVILAQNTTQCGSIIESEFTQNAERHDYDIEMSPGDKLRVSGKALGDYLAFGLEIYAPSGTLLADARTYWNAPSVETKTLSKPGIYRISLPTSGIGPYTIYIGCILRDGTEISAGDTIPNLADTIATIISSVAPSNQAVVGFPGLAPVNFASALKLPPSVGIPMVGAITPTGGEIIGFTVDANKGDKLDLSVSRVSGNLNLGIVILSPDNKVVFYGGLITGDSLTANITLPTAGQYTIGVFRVDLLPPDTPEATAFQVEGTLSP